MYFSQAFSMSTSFILARVHNQAKTSANSSALFLSFEASVVASSPTSSMNHRKVFGVPLCRSRFSYFSEIICWNWLIFIFSLLAYSYGIVFLMNILP